MRCQAVLMRLGERIARRSCEQRVPEKFCANWAAEWSAICDMISLGRLGLDEGTEALEKHGQKMNVARVIWSEVESE